MNVVIDLYGSDRIYIKSPYSEENTRLCKSIPGRRWSAEDKVWTYPRTMTTCREARAAFGDQLRILSQLSAWARQEVAQERALAEAGAAKDGELTRVPQVAPRMAQAMAGRPYQRAGAAFIRQAGSTVIADEVGLGKSLVALAGIIECDLWRGQHLVIAPKTALEAVWANEIRKWTDGAAVYAMPEGKAKREKTLAAYLEDTSDTKFLVVNKEMLRVKMDKWCAKCKCWLEDVSEMEHWIEQHKTKAEVREMPWPPLFDIVWSSVINDEAHKTISTGYKSTQQKTQMAEGVTRLKVAGLRLPVTGTPVRGKEVNLWGTMHWARPDITPAKWGFVDTFFEKSDNGYGIDILGIREEKRQQFNTLLDTCMLRRTRREVRSELPPRNPVDVWVRMDAKQEKQYTEFVQQGLAQLENGELSSTGLLAEITRSKQMAYGEWKFGPEGELIPTFNSPKLRRLEEMLEERGLTGNLKEDFRSGEGYKYIIASQFTQVVDSVQAYFEAKGITTLKITGAVTGTRRKGAVAAFQDDPDGPRLLVLNTMAGGESITLDRYCDEMFILDETYIADDQEQLEGRIDNRSVRGDGDQRPRTYHYFRTEGSIEETIASNNIDQREMQADLLDRRRGVEVAARLLRGGKL